MINVYLKRGELVGHFLCAFEHHALLKDHHRLNREIKAPFGQREVAQFSKTCESLILRDQKGPQDVSQEEAVSQEDSSQLPG